MRNKARINHSMHIEDYRNEVKRKSFRSCYGDFFGDRISVNKSSHNQSIFSFEKFSEMP